MKNALQSTKNFEIDGILVPNSWSARNRVLTIAIHSAGEQEYLIDSKNKAGKELKKFLGKRVKIKGELWQAHSDSKRIVVNAYEVFNW